MITVTSAEKNKIEEQMKTALPFLNEQLDFNLDIVVGKKGRSRLTLKQDEVVFELPIFYITPSTDDSAWEILTDRIEEEKDSQGVFFIRFNSEQHVVHNATTYALTNADLYQKNMLSEICRLCSYVDLDPYQVHLFDVANVTSLFEKLSNQGDGMEKAANEMENIEDETVKETELIKETPIEKKIEAKPTETKEAVVKEAAAKEVVVKEAVTKKAEVKEPVIAKEPMMKPESNEDAQLDSDIRALINDCFGIF